MNLEPCKIRSRIHIAWCEELAEGASVAAPAFGGGSFEVPGPQVQFVRASLELSHGEGESSARVLAATGQPLALAFRAEGPENLSRLPAAPLSLCACSDGGFWWLQRDGLHLIAASGRDSLVARLVGVRLIGDNGDGLWVVGLREAWHFDASGHMAGPFPWRFPLESICVGGRLCRLDKEKRATIAWLNGEGETQTSAVSGSPGPMERLVWVDDAVVWTSTSNTIRRFGPDGDSNDLDGELVLLGAGLTEQGEGFLSSVVGENSVLWCENNEPIRLPLTRAQLNPRCAAVTAVHGPRVLISDGMRNAWYCGGELERVLVLDDEAEIRELFRVQWQLWVPYAVVAAAGSRMLVPVSGPSGVAMLEFRCEMRN